MGQTAFGGEPCTREHVNFHGLTCCAASEGQDVVTIDLTEGSYISSSAGAGEPTLGSPAKRTALANPRALGLPFDGGELGRPSGKCRPSKEMAWCLEANGDPALWGRFRHRDGGMYVGESAAGRRHGQGTFSWPDGSTFAGFFQDDKMDGEGLYTWADGRQYKGEWKASQMSGDGAFFWPDARKYEGQYFKDAKEGTGTFWWPDGRQYHGGWKNGRQHGRGIIRDKQGGQYMGTWCDGRCMSMLEAPKDHSQLKEGRKCTVDIEDVAEEAEAASNGGGNGRSKSPAPPQAVPGMGDGDAVCHPTEASASDGESYAEDGSEDSLPLPYTEAGFSLGTKEAVSSLPKLDLIKVQEKQESGAKAKQTKIRKEGSKKKISATTLKV